MDLLSSGSLCRNENAANSFPNVRKYRENTMSYLRENTARAAMIALLATAPMSAFAVESGSPAQSVAKDPDEYAAPDSKNRKISESMYDTPKANQGNGAYDDADVVDDADNSIHEDGPKRDG